MKNTYVSINALIINQRPRLVARADAVNVFVNVTVKLVGGIMALEPFDGLAPALNLAHFIEIGVDGGLAGGEGDALANDDGLHRYSSLLLRLCEGRLRPSASHSPLSIYIYIVSHLE